MTGLFFKSRVLFFLSLFLFWLCNCSKPIPLTPGQKVFAGKWVSASGNLIEIKASGTIQLKIVKVNSGGLKTTTEITAAPVTIAPEKMVVSTGWIWDSTYRIDQRPIQDKSGLWSIIIDGEKYAKGGL